MHDGDQRRQFIAVERESPLLAGFSDAERRLLISLLARMHARMPIVNAGGEADWA
ncbi:MAG: hypothetical protein ACLQIQ_22235 [Beijerinckiaceae bacterium]